MWESRGTDKFAPSSAQMPRGVTFLSCPFREKDMAKKLGAKWDVARKAWYVPSGVAISPFARWLPCVVGTSTGASSAFGDPTASAAPVSARKDAHPVPSPSSVTAYREALGCSLPAPLAGLLLCTDRSSPSNRYDSTTKNEAGGRTGWWAHHVQAGVATALAAIVSMKAAAARCVGGVATTEANAVAKAAMDANVATKAELVTALEANSVMQAALVAVMEANVAVETELVSLGVELAAMVAVNEAAMVAITAADAVAAASVAFTTAAIGAVAASVVAISVATAFALPSLTPAAPESSGATSQPENDKIIQERAELIAHVSQVTLQHNESDEAVAAFAASFVPLAALVRRGVFDWMRILDDH